MKTTDQPYSVNIQFSAFLVDHNLCDVAHTIKREQVKQGVVPLNNFIMPVVTLQSYDCIITEKYGPDLGQSHRVSLEEAENDRKFMQ